MGPIVASLLLQKISRRNAAVGLWPFFGPTWGWTGPAGFWLDPYIGFSICEYPYILDMKSPDIDHCISCLIARAALKNKIIWFLILAVIWVSYQNQAMAAKANTMTLFAPLDLVATTSAFYNFDVMEDGKNSSREYGWQSFGGTGTNVYRLATIARQKLDESGACFPKDAKVRGTNYGEYNGSEAHRFSPTQNKKKSAQ